MSHVGGNDWMEDRVRAMSQADGWAEEPITGITDAETQAA